jgi:osmoprotectant transport system permease protein
VLADVIIHQRSATCETRNGFCPDWIASHWTNYLHPLWQHLQLVLVSVALGFVIAFLLAIVAHRRRWLVGPITGVTGILYTIPSIALFTILLPITGFGFVTAIIALTSYTLLIIFRNVVTGLANVPEDAQDAARGMGLTDRQRLWKVEVPLAMPEIFAGLRIATTTTVGLAALAFFAGAGGLGAQLMTDINFKSNIVLAGGLCVVLAVVLDGLLLLVERLTVRWEFEAR